METNCGLWYLYILVGGLHKGLYWSTCTCRFSYFQQIQTVDFCLIKVWSFETQQFGLFKGHSQSVTDLSWSMLTAKEDLERKPVYLARCNLIFILILIS